MKKLIKHRNLMANIMRLILVMGIALGVTVRFVEAAPPWAYEYKHYDDGSAMVLDEEGNIYVTGFSYKDDKYVHDFMTIKYNKDGKIVWEARTDRPGTIDNMDVAFAIALDKDDYANDTYIYVTGSSREDDLDNIDIMTVKYNDEGQEAENIVYDINHDSRVRAIDTDVNHNIYVSGFEAPDIFSSSIYTIIKYNSDLIELWVSHYDNYGSIILGGVEAQAVDSPGNVYVTGGRWYEESPVRFCSSTVKYHSDGYALWSKDFYDDFGLTSEGREVYLDEENDAVYVAGRAARVNGDDIDYFLVKYDASSGNEIWRAFGPEDDDPNQEINENVCALAVDNSENVYVAVQSVDWSGADNYSYLTAKFDKDGTKLWETRYMLQGGVPSDPDLDIDSDNNVFITGQKWAMGKQQWVTIKYDTDGDEIWNAVYKGNKSTGFMHPKSVIVDNQDESIYVFGNSETTMTKEDYTLIKYDQTGNRLWLARYDAFHRDGCELDRDSYLSGVCGGDDCDDTNPNVHPGRKEDPDTSYDDNCNGRTDCFIATAAYGTPCAEEIQHLRNFRDQHLLKNNIGKKFVELYYKYSPPAAEFISDKPKLRTVVRFLLKPLVWMSEKLTR